MIKVIMIVASMVTGFFVLDNAENGMMNNNTEYLNDFGQMFENSDEELDEYFIYRDGLFEAYDWDNMSLEERRDARAEIYELLDLKALELGIEFGHMGGIGYSSGYGHMGGIGYSSGYGHMSGYLNDSYDEIDMINSMIELAEFIEDRSYYSETEENQQVLLDELIYILDDNHMMNTYMIEYMLEREEMTELINLVNAENWSELTEEELITKWEEVHLAISEEFGLWGYGSMYNGSRFGSGSGRCH